MTMTQKHTVNHNQVPGSLNEDTGKTISASNAKNALDRLNETLDTLKNTLEQKIHFDENQHAMRAELTRITDERKRLSAKLDQAEGRAQSVQQITKDVSKRLGVIMDTIRCVLENQKR